MKPEDLIESIDFPPLVESDGKTIRVTKTFSKWSGRNIYDENKNLIGLKVDFLKSEDLEYRICENSETGFSISCAINKEILDDLDSSMGEWDMTKIFEGFI